tara:strand:- start:1695 stop:2147 length:453 start_codon:yes stop_codon:yes gene_type:complete
MDCETRKEIIKEARQRVYLSFSVYMVPYVYQEMILEAFDATDWDIMNMDGCTGVFDYWPNKFSPTCTPHDFQFMSGRGGHVSNVLFYETCKMYALPAGQSYRRYLGTQFFWAVWFKWKHKRAGNVKPITEKMKKAFEFTQKKGKFKAYKN